MKKSEWERARAAFSPLCNFGAEDRGRHPINCVMWAQASEYCKVMGKRLPSEMEFEFAARGSDGRRYPWGDAPPSERHLNGCGKECVEWRAEQGLSAVEPLYPGSDAYVGTAPIGSFPEGRTQAGLFDITGNVFEWTADPFRAYPQPGVDAPPEEITNNRVIRGEGVQQLRAGAHRPGAAPALRRRRVHARDRVPLRGRSGVTSRAPG